MAASDCWLPAPMPAAYDRDVVEIAGQRADHIDARHRHHLRLLLDGEFGLAADDEIGRIAARRRMLGLGLHLVGDSHLSISLAK